MSSSTSKLFQPIQAGNVTLQHRVVMAPLTRLRANGRHELGDLSVEYYTQRASVPGTLIITEATIIAARAGGFPDGPNVPGIWTDGQIAGWKKIVDAIHAKGSFVYLQLFAMGRAARPAVLAHDDLTLPYVSAGDIPLTDREDRTEMPRPLTIAEIKEYIELYAIAATNAVSKAGFDGVEFHAASGYLLDQFIQPNANNRMDEYGGSIENRIRLPLEALDAVIKAVGSARKVGFRISPWGRYQEMGMEDPVPTFTELVMRVRDAYPDLAYLHVSEARVHGTYDRDFVPEHENNDFLREIWAPRPYIAVGGFNRDTAIESAETKGDLVAFGRHFISNPDLPMRLQKGLPLTPYDRSTFYAVESPKGYADYPFAKETPQRVAVKASV